jgi:hypothetical protein
VLFLGQVAIEEYRASRDTEVKAAQIVQQSREQRTQLLDTLFNEYLGLGERADRAGEFIETSEGGSKEDVLAVVRHFRRVIAYVVNGRLEVAPVSGMYGGRLAYWGQRLKQLGDGRSPVSNHFTEENRRNFLVLADALGALAGPSSPDAPVVAEAIPAAPAMRIRRPALIDSAHRHPTPRGRPPHHSLAPIDSQAARASAAEAAHSVRDPRNAQ